MTKKRRVFQDGFKAKVALAALKGDKTLAELSSQFAVHVNQVSAWRSVVAERASELFRDGRTRPDSEREVELISLYEQIGRLKMELEWVKKKSTQLG